MIHPDIASEWSFPCESLAVLHLLLDFLINLVLSGWMIMRKIAPLFNSKMRSG